MNPERWKQVKELFSAVLDLDDIEKRAAYLDQACAGDEALKKEVETLLAFDGQADSVIESPALHMASELLTGHAAMLSPGDTIGPYKILSPLGAGGMGEVYRADDPRIGREVAIKILPSHFSKDPDRVRRFEQEARATGILNHPNIVAIHDAGTENGLPYLVSELLQGELLRRKLKGSPLPVRKSVDYSLQIAKGLSAAHEKGIVHRDLKPENIFITKEGRAKILDFGLAKLTQPETSTGQRNLESENHQTDTGVIVGTVVYMSPEQVRGLKVDHRSDIFAFGAILFEMLSGKRPFQGESQIEVMHAILKTDPSEFLQVTSNIPAGLQRIVMRCLEKDPDHRFQSTNDLAFALESLSSASGTSAEVMRLKTPIPFAWILSAFFFLAALVLAVFLFRSGGKTAPESPPEVRRLSIVLPENSILNSLALSPDGRRVAYVVNAPTGLSKLWLRSLNSTQSEEIAGTEDAFFPFWSPDSRSIGFFTQRELKMLTIGAGPPESLCKVDVPKGGTWNQDGVILFAPTNGGPLYRIRSSGGEMTPVTTPGEGARFPQFLPDGRHFFFISLSENPNVGGLCIGSLDSKSKKRLSDDLMPAGYVDPGYAFFVPSPNFVPGGKLMVRPFDINRLEFSGEATPIADEVESWWVTGPYFSVSKNNVLVYGQGGGWKSQPIWFDQAGKQLSALGQPGGHAFADMSSDEKRMLTINDGKIWMADLLNGTFARFAIADPISDETNGNIAFSPDGSHVAYVDSHDNLYQRLSNGTGDAQLLFHTDREDDWVRNLSWSPDGKFIIFTRQDPDTKFDLWVVPLFGNRKPFPYLKMEAREDNARFSPDGKWIAYESDETGQPEIYVRSFPAETSGKWQLSTVGAEQPIWRSDGKELFYLTLDKKLMATKVKTGQTFEAGSSRLLFQTRIGPRINNTAMASSREYFVGSDGQRFLINTLVENKAPEEINVLLNWKSLLKKQ